MTTLKGKALWVDVGYREMAAHGPDVLRPDYLAKKVGKSRSGFYHSFGNIAGFEKALFDHHLYIANEFSQELTHAKALYPDYIHITVKYKDWVFFHRQLALLGHENPKFMKTFEKAADLTERKTMELWKHSAGLADVPEKDLLEFYRTVRATIFTRLKYSDFNAESFYREIKEINRSFNFLLK